MEASKVKLDFTHDGLLARLTLAAPKGNIIDASLLGDLDREITNLQKHRGVRAIVLAAEGPHFSFGASIEEHLPEQIESALDRLHSMLRRMLDLPAPTVAAIQGQCLGGGLELALGCDFLIADPGARFATPEIKLGVFPPAASALLPLRVTGGRANCFLLTGTSWEAEVALRYGLVNALAPAGELTEFVDAWVAAEFFRSSAVGLRNATLAARWQRRHSLEEILPKLEQQYLNQLMTHPDAVEGIRAFLEKRPPRWTEEPE